MLCIAEYNPFFIKKTFNIPDHKTKYKKKIVIDYDEIFYALFYKLHNYDHTHINNKINEKQEKIKLAVEIEKNIRIGKNEKIKPKDKENIIQNLMYDTKINLRTLNALCLFYKINLLYIKDNIFIRMCYGEKVEPKDILDQDKSDQDKSDQDKSDQDTSDILDSSMYSNYLFMDTNRFVDVDMNIIEKKYEVNLDKPLRCASYYKIDDLKKISIQLHLPFENTKKQQLYDSIQNVLNKLNV
jgi:hypothetical protein